MPSAAILAGGRATRFGGRDKSALVVAGRSILDRQVDELAALTDDIMVVGGADGRSTSVRHLPDRLAGAGPLAGLDAALRHARHDPLVVVACDMPFVTSRFLRYLIALSGEADAVVPRTDRGYHPLCAVYARACEAPLARVLADGRRAVVDLLREVTCRIVGEYEIAAFGDPARLLANINTPAEYDALAAGPGHEL